jgi:hypothetical protein
MVIAILYCVMLFVLLLAFRHPKKYLIKSKSKKKDIKLCKYWWNEDEVVCCNVIKGTQTVLMQVFKTTTKSIRKPLWYDFLT